MGAGLLAKAVGQSTSMLTVMTPSRASPQVDLHVSARDWLAGSPPSRASPLPQRLGTSAKIRSAGRPPSRAGSHSWAGYIRKKLADRQAAIASKLAPTEEQRQSSPHRAASHHSSGRALARLQLLILIHPPPRQAERRCSSGDGRAAPFDAVELIACRSKRSRPEGNAPG
ncbi:hypothetical protein PputUW4_03307 [Pseudomonas sp. UW4]|nr:hypothetical protein PputUW4_03307 [Pseudomonas sp. UW4]